MIPVTIVLCWLAACLPSAFAVPPFGTYDDVSFSPTVTVLESDDSQIRLQLVMEHLPQGQTVDFATRLPGLWENMNTTQSSHYLPRFAVTVALPNTGNPTVVIESWETTTMNANPISLQQNTPGQPQAEIGTVGILGGVRVAPLTVKPISYTNNASTCDVITTAVIRIDIDDQSGTNPVTDPRTSFSRPWQEVFKSVVTNWEYIPNIQVGAESHMLMIVPNNFSTAITDYVRWKEQRGMKVTVVLKNSIGQNPTADQIRSRILTEVAASNPRIDYVTLVGDETQLAASYLNTADLDTRFSWGDSYPGNYTNEGVFSCLEGSDTFPDVFLGRWIVNSQSEVAIIGAKEILHERDTFIQDSLRFEHAVIAADNTESSQRATVRHVGYELLAHGFGDIDSVFNFNGAQQMINSVDAGQTFVNYRGSGWDFGWWGIQFLVQQVAQLNNVRKLPICTGIGCGVGKFDAGDGQCFGEAWMLAGTVNSPKGSAGFIGPCWNTHTVFNDCLDSLLYRAFLNYDVLNLQPALVSGKMMVWALMSDYMDESPLLEVMNVLMRQYLVLCDPSLQVFTDTPVRIEGVAPAAVPSGEQVNYAVTVDNLDQLPVDSVQVTAWLGDQNFVTGWLHQGESSVVLALNTAGADSMVLTITGDNSLAYRRTVTVGPAGPYLLHTDYTLDDSQGGNGDLKVNPGETVNWIEALWNIGSTDALDASAALTSSNLDVSITQPTIQLGTVTAGQTMTAGTPFTFAVADEAVANEALNFNVTFSMSNGPSQSWPVTVKVHAPDLMIQDVAISDGNDGIWDRGEATGLAITLRNHGNGAMLDASCTLTTADSLISIEDGETTLPVIFDSTNFALPTDAFSLRSSWVTPSGHVATLNLNITADMGTYTYTAAIPFQVTMGQVTEADPFSDSGSHYWVYDDIDSIYSERPNFDWIEVALNAGGPGEEIPFSQGNQTFAFPTPFDFNYYGVAFDSLSISTDGWVKPGRTTQTNAINSILPNNDNIPGMVAPLWFNLWRTQGGSETGQICYYYDTASDRFVVEWYQVHDVSGVYAETFQVQLLNPATYPTASGDAEWLFLYQSVSTRATSSQGATVGMENPAHNVGFTDVYHGVYASGAAALAAGRAIKVTTEPPQILTAANPRESVIPTEIMLAQNYPNPFNPETVIEFALPRSDYVKLSVFDVLGRDVATLVNGPLAAGEHRVTWRGGMESGVSAASGIYFYRLQTSQSLSTRKMILLR
jgi:hypothetical protein